MWLWLRDLFSSVRILHGGSSVESWPVRLLMTGLDGKKVWVVPYSFRSDWQWGQETVKNPPLLYGRGSRSHPQFHGSFWWGLCHGPSKVLQGTTKCNIRKSSMQPPFTIRRVNKQFIMELADNCNYKTLRDKIRDRLVVGIRDKSLLELMQLDTTLDLEKAKMARWHEAVHESRDLTAGNTTVVESMFASQYN